MSDPGYPVPLTKCHLCSPLASASCSGQVWLSLFPPPLPVTWISLQGTFCNEISSPQDSQHAGAVVLQGDNPSLAPSSAADIPMQSCVCLQTLQTMGRCLSWSFLSHPTGQPGSCAPCQPFSSEGSQPLQSGSSFQLPWEPGRSPTAPPKYLLSICTHPPALGKEGFRQGTGAQPALRDLNPALLGLVLSLLSPPGQNIWVLSLLFLLQAESLICHLFHLSPPDMCRQQCPEPATPSSALQRGQSTSDGG